MDGRAEENRFLVLYPCVKIRRLLRCFQRQSAGKRTCLRAACGRPRSLPIAKSCAPRATNAASKNRPVGGRPAACPASDRIKPTVIAADIAKASRSASFIPRSAEGRIRNPYVPRTKLDADPSGYPKRARRSWSALIHRTTITITFCFDPRRVNLRRRLTAQRSLEIDLQPDRLVIGTGCCGVDARGLDSGS